MRCDYYLDIISTHGWISNTFRAIITLASMTNSRVFTCISFSYAFCTIRTSAIPTFWCFPFCMSSLACYLLLGTSSYKYTKFSIITTSTCFRIRTCCTICKFLFASSSFPFPPQWNETIIYLIQSRRLVIDVPFGLLIYWEFI